LRLRRRIAFVTGLLAIGVGAGVSQQKPVDQQIVELLRADHSDTALEMSKRALVAHPDDCKLLSLEGLAYSGMGQSDAALSSFKRSIAHCPKYLVALEGAAQIEFARKDPAAIPLLETVVAEKAEDVTAHAMLASLLASEGQCEKAMPHFAASADLLATRKEFQEQYGRCLAQTGDYAGALKQFQSIAAARPNDADLYNVAVLQWKTHQAKEALATLEPLIAAKTFQAAFVLGSKISEELGDTPRAVELLRTAIQLSPDDVDAYLEFSNLAYDHHSFPVGVEMLNAGLQRLPKAARLYLARGVLEVQMSQIDKALSDFEEAHKLDNQLSFAVDALGLVQTQQHQDAAALQRFQQEVKLHPNDPFLQYLLAEQLAQSADASGEVLKEAIAAATASTRLNPTYQAAQDLLIVLLMRAKEPALAIEQAEKTLEQNPMDESALYQELLARKRLGQTELLEPLTARLVAARQANALQQQKVDKYRLQGESGK
jgi:tetratricopeptide (TPR) repeat protein